MTTGVSLTLDALCGEIGRLRRLSEESGHLSRSNKRLLAKYKKLLRERLGAAVVYPEDRQQVPRHARRELLARLKQIDGYLKEQAGSTYNGRFYHLMCDSFDFGVSPATVKRIYYMSDDERSLKK